MKILHVYLTNDILKFLNEKIFKSLEIENFKFQFEKIWELISFGGYLIIQAQR